MDNKDLEPMTIDFDKARDEEGKINESWWLTFGAILRWIMPSLYKGSVFPLQVRGSQADVSSFANVLSKEKKYLQSWKNNGLDDPLTYQNKSKLNGAIGKFERITGLRWPFTR